MSLDAGGDGGARAVTIGPVASADDAPAISDVALEHAWREFDLAHGLPRLDDGQLDRWTPQQLSLDRLRAYSVKKGCYPGQEIVARTHFLGQAKRGLVLLEAHASLVAGSPVRVGGADAGTVVSTAGTLALAVLPLERDASAPIEVAGATARERPLLGGLAR